MAGSARNDLKQLIFKSGSAVNKLIAANVVVFIILGLVRLVVFIMQTSEMYFEDIISWLAVPAALPILATRPWTIFTYMFVHIEFMHILFNMLWLFWIGKIFEEYLGYRKFTFVYIAGGLAGGAFFIAFSNLVPAFHTISPTIGASASVMAIIAATATLLPDYGIGLLFLGTVKLRWLAIGYVVLDIIVLPGGNIGGQLAHLGGALLGFIYVQRLRKGNDWSAPFVKLFSPKPSKTHLKVAYRAEKTSLQNKEKSNEQIIDEILDKISKFGYTSLTEREKQQLFRASQDID